MNPKIFLETFPYGYKRLRNTNGSIALVIDSEFTDAYVFVKKIPQNKALPRIPSQNYIDYLQSGFDKSRVIIDWFDNGDCRFILTCQQSDLQIKYDLVLNVAIDGEIFDVRGYFNGKCSENIRKTTITKRYLTKMGEQNLYTEMDFTDEKYDILFPDDPLSHCRRLANVLALTTVYIPSNCKA